MSMRVDLRRAAAERVTRLRAHMSEPLFSSAYHLMANTVLTAGLGLGFWAAAAHLFATSEVGRDAVLISALATLSSICQLNLVDALVRFLPGMDPGKRIRTITAAYGASALAAAVGGTAFVLVAPLATRQLGFLSDDPVLAPAFVVSLVFWGAFVIQDAVLTSLRRARWVPIENSAFGLAKLALLPALLAAGSSNGVFLAWVAPVIAIVVVINFMLFKRVLAPEARSSPPAPVSSARLRRAMLARFLVQDYAGFVLVQVPDTLLPLVVLSQLGGRASAYFAIPFALISAFDVLFYSVTMSLTVEAARDESRTVELARSVMRRFLSLQVPAAGLIVLLAPILLLPFGPAYVQYGAAPLRLLACASVFRTFGYMFVALARLRLRGMEILVAQAALAVISVGVALLLVRPLGLPGVALGWMIANAAVALGTVPRLWHFLRRRPAPPAVAPGESDA